MQDRTSDAPAHAAPLLPDVDPTAEATPVDATAPRPDLDRTRAALAGPRAVPGGITVLAVLAVLYTLYFARDFLIPITFALLLSFVLSPLVRALARVRVRPPLGAALVMVGLLGGVGAGVYELSGPVQTWVAGAPATLTTARGRLRGLLRPLERVQRTAEQVQSATSVAGPATAPTVVVQGPTLLERLFGTTQRFLAGLLEVVILLYFLLAAGDLFLQKLIKVLPGRREKDAVVEIARETEASISAYLLTAAALNVGEGIVVAGAMWLLGMPNPALWGALVALLEFIPYLGALTMVAILTLAALTTFDGPGRALLVPATFLAINLVQANVVSPLLLGNRLSLNPVALLVGLAFWFWMWGVPGAFIAVPLLAAFKILCDHLPALASVGEFLGHRDEGERRAMVR
jgi:predicted PurR-regulated permease PerM